MAAIEKWPLKMILYPIELMAYNYTAKCRKGEVAAQEEFSVSPNHL